MQPARLGAAMRCLVRISLFGSFAVPLPSRAQTVETPQQTNDRIRELSNAARIAPHDYVIGTGDIISIDVFDVKELSRDVRVSQTGTIGIPLVPVRLHVAGLTEIQAEQKIAEVLESNGLVTHADVSVTVKERKSKPITIVGAVGHPLVYQADRPVTLVEVLAEAGGLAPDAGDHVIITRKAPEMNFDDSEPPAISPEDAAPLVHPPKDSAPQRPLPGAASSPALPNPTASPASATAASNEPPELTGPNASSAKANDPNASGVPAAPGTDTITVNLYELMEAGNTSNNLVLQAGDLITVPHSGIVYVLGAVARPGGFVLTNDREKLTTLKILALAGGWTQTAKTEKAVVIRKDQQGQEHDVQLDLKKIRNRQAEDLQLQPSDILYVPESGTKIALLRSVELGIALGSAVALYRVAYH
jgi:polysaccharide biosynthesis/export protein